jgi:hypothetical protein
MFTSQQFRAEIEAFLNRNKSLSPTAFGRLVARDGNLVGDIAAGRMPSLRTVERIAAFIERYDGKLSAEQIKRLVKAQPPGTARPGPHRSSKPIRKIRRVAATSRGCVRHSQ